MASFPTGESEAISSTELQDIVNSQLRRLIDQRNLEGAKALLVPVKAVDVAEAIGSLPKAMQLVAFRLLPRGKAVEVYEYCSTDVQEGLIQDFQDQDILDIVDSMAPDDRASLFDELPPQVVRRIFGPAHPRRAPSHVATARLPARNRRSSDDPGIYFPGGRPDRSRGWRADAGTRPRSRSERPHLRHRHPADPHRGAFPARTAAG